MKRLLQIIALVMLMAGMATGQTATEALRYSTTDVFGTARSIAVGGAMGALGADFSVINVNPAGTGAYRSSEFLISGMLLTQSTEAELVGGGIPASSNNDTRFNISSIGIVFATQPKNRTWKASNFALGYNKVADYNLEFNYSGRNVGSIVERWQENSIGLFPNELNAFEELLAFETGAIYDLDPADQFYETDYELNPEAELLRRQRVTRTGGNGEVVLSYGANYNEKLLFGITLGVPILSYEETKDYEEEDGADDAVPFFNALRFEETLRTTGNGFNAKLGLNYKVTKYLTIGGAYHTRTRYSLSDNFGTRLTYDYSIDNERFVFTSPPGGPQEGSFNYNFSAPSSFVGNVGYILTVRDGDRSKRRKPRGRKSKKRNDDAPRKYLGFVVAQIHHKNYSKAKFDYSGRGNGDQFEDQERFVNESIESSFSGALELRFGTEFVFKDFRFRGGFITTQSPFADDTSFNNTYSAGAGYRFKRIFLDFGYQFRKEELAYSPYSVQYAPMTFVTNNTNFNRFVFTVGYKWL